MSDKRWRILDYTGRYRVIAQFQFEPRDLWVGLFWRRSMAEWPIWHFYICLVPMVPLHITCGRWTS